MGSPIFFKSQVEFRRWLANNHASHSELWLGMYKKASGKGGITYREALDEALCFGWIDGVRKSLDARELCAAIHATQEEELLECGEYTPRT